MVRKRNAVPAPGQWNTFANSRDIAARLIRWTAPILALHKLAATWKARSPYSHQSPIHQETPLSIAPNAASWRLGTPDRREVDSAPGGLSSAGERRTAVRAPGSFPGGFWRLPAPLPPGSPFAAALPLFPWRDCPIQTRQLISRRPGVPGSTRGQPQGDRRTCARRSSSKPFVSGSAWAAACGSWRA